MFSRPALLMAGVGVAAAQSISSQCSSALLSVMASPDATCLDLSLLAPLAVTNSTSTSIIPTINSWLTGICSQGPCSNATLQAVVTNVTTGCSTDLAALGLSTSDPAALLTTVEATYPAVRQVACLQDTSTNTLCATEQLTDIQSSTNATLTGNHIINLIIQLVSGQNISLPQNMTCDNCSKAAYTILAQDFPTLVTSYQAVFQSECGSSFTDGQMPSNVKETAANATSTTTGGATSLSVSSFDVGVAMLIAVCSAFAIFA